MRLWIDVIHFRFVSSWKKKQNKKGSKTKKEFTRFVLNKEGKVNLKNLNQTSTSYPFHFSPTLKKRKRKETRFFFNSLHYLISKVTLPNFTKLGMLGFESDLQ